MDPHIVHLLFMVIFYANPQCGMCWLFDYFFCWEFSLLLFSKSGFKRLLNTRKPFKNNIVKGKTKQSWKGNVWKHYTPNIFHMEQEVMMMMKMMNWFCGMVDRQKVFGLFSSDNPEILTIANLLRATSRIIVKFTKHTFTF